MTTLITLALAAALAYAAFRFCGSLWRWATTHRKSAVCLGLLVLAFAGLASVTHPTPQSYGNGDGARVIEAPKLTPLQATLAGAGFDMTGWSKGGFDTVAMISFRLTTPKDGIAIKDVEIECQFTGKSGTVTTTTTRTVLEVVSPGKPATFRNVNFGFITTQTASAACRLVDATAF